MTTQGYIAPGNLGRTWVHMQVYESQGCSCNALLPLWLFELDLEIT